jgi:hypothetical protein
MEVRILARVFPRGKEAQWIGGQLLSVQGPLPASPNPGSHSSVIRDL